MRRLMNNIILLLSLAVFSVLDFNVVKGESKTQNRVVAEETRSRIVVIDTGISPEHHQKNFMCNDHRAIPFNSGNYILIKMVTVLILSG